MRKVTELEAVAISKEHRNAVGNSRSAQSERHASSWIGKAFGIERTLIMLGIRFEVDEDGSLMFHDVEK